MTQAMWGYLPQIFAGALQLRKSATVQRAQTTIKATREWLVGLYAWALQPPHHTRHAHHPAVALPSSAHGTHTLHNIRKASPLASIPRQKKHGSLLAKNHNRGNSNPGFERDMLVVKSCFCWVFC
jgi:hypothetical protein